MSDLKLVGSKGGTGTVTLTVNETDTNSVLNLPIGDGVLVKSINSVTSDNNGNVNIPLAVVAKTGSYNDLIDKPNITTPPKTYITQTYSGSTNWYRVWSNGFIEQWGLLNGSGGGGTVTFPKRFSNTAYIFVVTPNEEETSGQWFAWGTSNKTTSSINSTIMGGASDGAPKQSWYAAGF